MNETDMNKDRKSGCYGQPEKIAKNYIFRNHFDSLRRKNNERNGK